MKGKIKNMEWNFQPETGSLTVRGRGAMEDWGEWKERPWEDFREAIHSVMIDSGITGIGNGAFRDCTALEEVELADTVERLGVFSFRGCSALKKITLPRGVWMIGAKAFQRCTALEQVWLPASLKYVDMRAFAGDEALHTVVYEGTPVQWERILISMTASDNRCLLGAEREYLGATGMAGAAVSEKQKPSDQYEQIIQCARRALSYGGDGNLYLLTPRLTEPGIRAKCGDCTLAIFPNGRTMMIDAGYIACSEHIIRLLSDLGLTHLDAFVLSHAHDDHAGGALAVAEYLYDHGGGIDAFYRSSYVKSSKREPEFEDYLKQKNCQIHSDVLEGYQWTVGEVRITAYYPTQEALDQCDNTDEGVNDVSILMKFQYGNSAYPTGGDLCIDKEELLAARYGTKLQADVMKSNHHGVYTSNGDVWLRTVTPGAIITDSEDIGNPLLVEYAAGNSIDYYSAGVHGLILVRMDRQSYDVISQY